MSGASQDTHTNTIIGLWKETGPRHRKKNTQTPNRNVPDRGSNTQDRSMLLSSHMYKYSTMKCSFASNHKCNEQQVQHAP